MEACVERLVLQYAQSVPATRPLDARLSLRNDLAIESLSLVSLALRLGGELGVDIAEAGLELHDLKTIGDLVNVARSLERQSKRNGRHPVGLGGEGL
jgi:acyl carrier protein